MSSLVGQTALQKKLLWFWDMIDISENIKRAERTARGHSNGLGAWMNAVAMAILTIVAFSLAYKFDFESTFIGMSTLRSVVLTDLPASVLKFSTWIIIALTIAPTVIELFTAAYAKADVKIMQIYIMGFTGFDLITDIPRALTFTNQLQANFDQLGAFSGLAYWAFFIVWLFLSTIGFELGLMITGYLTAVYLIKAIAGDEQPVRSFGKGSGGSGMPKQTVIVEEERIKVT